MSHTQNNTRPPALPCEGEGCRQGGEREPLKLPLSNCIHARLLGRETFAVVKDPRTDRVELVLLDENMRETRREFLALGDSRHEYPFAPIFRTPYPLDELGEGCYVRVTCVPRGAWEVCDALTIQWNLLPENRQEQALLTADALSDWPLGQVGEHIRSFDQVEELVIEGMEVSLLVQVHTTLGHARDVALRLDLEQRRWQTLWYSGIVGSHSWQEGRPLCFPPPYKA